MCRLGEVVGGETRFNRLGELANESWPWLQGKFPAVRVPVYCVMPNHAHAVIVISEPEVSGSEGRDGLQTAPTSGDMWKKPLGRLVGAYKTHSTVLINQIENTPGVRFWQRNYYERVIRNEREFVAIYDYIQTNPLNWDKDEYR